MVYVAYGVSGLSTIVGTFTDYAGGTWSLLSVEPFKLASKAKLINISLPERLLGRAVLEYIGRHNVA